MADEFNPQGVDQTPQNNENPNNTADTGNIEPKNPFVGGASVDAGNASDSSEQQAPVPPAAPAADQRPTQAVTDTAATEPIPDYASAKGESTVVSSSPASPAAPAADQTSATTPLYRPAPEYGAYGPTPTQAQGQQGGQGQRQHTAQHVLFHFCFPPKFDMGILGGGWRDRCRRPGF